MGTCNQAYKIWLRKKIYTWNRFLELSCYDPGSHFLECNLPQLPLQTCFALNISVCYAIRLMMRKLCSVHNTNWISIVHWAKLSHHSFSGSCIFISVQLANQATLAITFHCYTLVRNHFLILGHILFEYNICIRNWLKGRCLSQMRPTIFRDLPYNQLPYNI